jgi:hypothetical protein
VPVVFVHGVNTRRADLPESVRRYLERYVVPAVAAGPGAEVEILYPYWATSGASFIGEDPRGPGPDGWAKGWQTASS